MLEIWELFSKQHKKATKLPLIIPVVVYHGRAKGKAVRLADLIHIPDVLLRGYVPDFDMNFCDFSPRANEAIKGQMLLQSALFCLKAAHHTQAHLMVVEVFKCIGQLDDGEYAMQWVEMVWRYVSEAVDIKPEEVTKIVQQNFSEKRREQS